MKRDLTSGFILIAGAATGILVMLRHPTGHALMEAGPQGHLAFVNRLVHGLALAATPMVFLGLVGLWRRLESTRLGLAALVAYGWAGVAVMSAAVASGFVATDVIASLAESEKPGLSRDFITYTGMLNHGFARVYVVGTCVAIALFAAAILLDRRFSRAAGIAGATLAPLILVLFLSGRLTLDVHGFGIIIFAESAWLIWVGALLCRG